MLAGILAIVAALFLLVGCTDDAAPTQSGAPLTTAAATPEVTPTSSPSPAGTSTAPASVPTTPPPAPTSATAATAVATPSSTPTASATAPSLPSETSVVQDGIPVPPRRDLYELSRALRQKSAEPIPYLRHQISSDLQVGQVDTFKVLSNVDPVEFREIEATLEHVSGNAYWYVENGVRFNDDSLRESAVIFEERIMPGLQSSFGPLWGPEDPPGQKLTILHAPTRGLGGYYSSADEYPVQVHENSNQRKMIYINPSALRIGTERYLSVLAHELQHAVNWNLSGGQSTWLNEGLSQVAEQRLGWRPASVEAFVHSGPTSLVYWPLSFRDTRPYYGSSFMFSQFLTEQVGSPGSLEVLVRAHHRGIHAVDAYLESLGSGESFESIFGRWTVAAYLSEMGQGGAYGYARWWPSVDATDELDGDGDYRFGQPQFSARYLRLDLDSDSAEVSFASDTSVNLVSSHPPTGGHCWWGNYGDTISSTLTREFDLSGLQQATLNYTAWYSIEEDWDYAYVLASTDGGSTWDVLQGALASTDNPSLNAYGPGYTGESDGWVADSVDLTAYAGRSVLVRFHYVTDDAITGQGICVDSVAVPELGFYDDASANQGWTSEGFYRTDNRVPQDFVVHLIEIRGDDVSVTPMALDGDNRGSLSVTDADDADDVVLVVGSLAEHSRQPASYTVTVTGGS